MPVFTPNQVLACGEAHGCSTASGDAFWADWSANPDLKDGTPPPPPGQTLSQVLAHISQNTTLTACPPT